ncbi:MAG TPA: hypothetical protein V6D11_24375 [Waterburya sp.]
MTFNRRTFNLASELASRPYEGNPPHTGERRFIHLRESSPRLY